MSSKRLHGRSTSIYMKAENQYKYSSKLVSIDISIYIYFHLVETLESKQKQIMKRNKMKLYRIKKKERQNEEIASKVQATRSSVYALRIYQHRLKNLKLLVNLFY